MYKYYYACEGIIKYINWRLCLLCWAWYIYIGTGGWLADIMYQCLCREDWDWIEIATWHVTFFLFHSYNTFFLFIYTTLLIQTLKYKHNINAVWSWRVEREYRRIYKYNTQSFYYTFNFASLCFMLFYVYLKSWYM